MPLPAVPATNIGMSDLAKACGVSNTVPGGAVSSENFVNLSLNGLRSGTGGPTDGSSGLVQLVTNFGGGTNGTSGQILLRTSNGLGTGASGNTSIGISGKYFLNNITLSGYADYKNHNYSIYGWDPVEITATGFDLDSLKQKLNVFSLSVGLEENNLKNKLNYNLNLGINYLKNTHDIHEFVFDFTGYLSSELSDAWSLDLGAGLTNFSQNDSTGGNLARMLIQLKPVVSYELENFTVKAGVNAVTQDDPIEAEGRKYHFFPVLGINYMLSKEHQVKALIDGNVEKVSLNRLYNENPYLDTLTQANNNINNFSSLFSLDGSCMSSCPKIFSARPNS